MSIVVIFLCIGILVSCASASPQLKTPVITGEKDGLIGSLPAVQPALAPSFTGGTSPGVSSGFFAPVREPVSFTQRCQTCGQDPVNGSEPDFGLTRISIDAESQKIAEIQANISREGAEWIAGHTSVSNLTPDAFTRLLGAVPTDAIETSVTVPLPSVSVQALPSPLTWQSNGGDYTKGLVLGSHLNVFGLERLPPCMGREFISFFGQFSDVFFCLLDKKCCCIA